MRLLKLKTDGYCNNDIILTIINVLKEINFDNEIKIKLIDIASSTYMRVNDGIDTNLQLLSCMCKFYEILKN